LSSTASRFLAQARSVCTEARALRTAGSCARASRWPPTVTRACSRQSAYTYGGAGANFTLPDFRGRSPLGAGTGTAFGATAHALGAPATTGLGGEQTHLELAAEAGVNGNGVTPSGGGVDHLHVANGGGNFVGNVGGSGANLTLGGGGYTQPTVTGAADRSLNHTHSLTARNADSRQNILHPVQVVNFIIKA